MKKPQTAKLSPINIACVIGALAALWSCGSDSNDPPDTNDRGGSSGASSNNRGGSQSSTGGSQSGNTGGNQGKGGNNQGSGGTSNQGGSGNAGTGGSDASGGTAGSAGSAGQSSGSKVCPAGPFGEPFDGDQVVAQAIDATETSQGSHLYEGAVWIGDALYYSSMNPNQGADADASKIMKLVPPSTVSTAVPSSGSNGLAVDANGLLVACMQGTQSVTRINLSTGQRTPIATEFNNKPFNSPNDLAIRSDGTIYFTDPNYQLDDRTGAGELRVYRIAPNGDVFDIEPEGNRVNVPNGIALSPDEKTLYVVSNGSGYVRAFPINADGSTGKGTNLIDDLNGPDGMTVDCAGNLYVTEHSAGDIVVFGPKGNELGRIVGEDPPMQSVTNAAFGGADRKTLYITTGSRVYSVRLGVPGLPY